MNIIDESCVVREFYLSRNFEINRLDDALILVKGLSSMVIESKDDLKALKRFINKVLEEDDE